MKKVLHRRRRAYEGSAGRERRAAARALADGYTPPARAAATSTARTSCRASRPCSTCSRSRTSARSNAPDTFVRPIYAGNAMATVQSSRRDQGHHRPRHRLRSRRGRGRLRRRREPRRRPPMPGLSSFVGRELSKSERPELTAARIIVSGGRGMGSGENFKILESLADKLGAAVGASRAAVDAGYRAERLPGRPDRQDRRPRALHRGRHLRRHPASGRHEGQQGHRRHQQGRGSADLLGGRLRPGRRPVQGGAGARRPSWTKPSKAAARGRRTPLDDGGRFNDQERSA